MWRWSRREIEREIKYKGVGIEKIRRREVGEWNWLRIFNWLDY